MTPEPEIDPVATAALHDGYDNTLAGVRERVAEARQTFKDAERALAYWERAERLFMELDCHHLSVAKGSSADIERDPTI